MLSLMPDSPDPDQFEQMRRQLSTGSGVRISYVDYTPQDARVLSAASPPCLALCVFLEGHGESVLADRSRIQFAQDQFLLFSSPRATVSENHLPPLQRLRAVEIHFTAQTLDQLRLMDIQHSFAQLAGAARLRPAGPGSFLYQLSASPEVRAIAEQIFRNGSSDASQQLFLHSKALELLSLTVGALQAAPNGGQLQVLAQRDQRKLERARACLLAQLDHNWSIAALAQAVNLNERKLKQGFKALFGNTIHAYQQEKRMEAAAHLLRQSELSITEVVMQTGYANPSHFGKLFRRHFGMSPREYTQLNPP